jgi:hypothetical protein
VPKWLVAYTTAYTGNPFVRLNGDCVKTDYGIVHYKFAIIVASAPLHYVVVAHVPLAVAIIIV